MRRPSSRKTKKQKDHTQWTLPFQRDDSKLFPAPQVKAAPIRKPREYLLYKNHIGNEACVIYQADNSIFVAEGGFAAETSKLVTLTNASVYLLVSTNTEVGEQYDFTGQDGEGASNRPYPRRQIVGGQDYLDIVKSSIINVGSKPFRDM